MLDLIVPTSHSVGKKYIFLRGNHQIKEKYEDIWKAILLSGLPLFYVKVKDSEHEIMWAE